MTADRDDQRCARCNDTLAEVVAVYRRPNTENDPYGSTSRVALCVVCTMRALGEPFTPTRLEPHPHAVARHARQERREHERRRADLKRAQLRLGEW